jgi:hypothetical protein
MALTKTVTHAVAVAGVHTLTLSDVDDLRAGYQISVAGVGQSFDGTHTIATVDADDLEITFSQGNHTHAGADVYGQLNVVVQWVDDQDVLGFLGVDPATQLDEDWLAVAVDSGNEWCFERRRKCGYADLPNVVPNPSVKAGTIMKAAQEYRERGSVESFASFDAMPTPAILGGGLGQILTKLGCNRPRFA